MRRLEGEIIALGVDEARYAKIAEEAGAEMARAVAAADAASYPPPETAYTDVQDVGAPEVTG